MLFTNFSLFKVALKTLARKKNGPLLFVLFGSFLVISTARAQSLPVTGVVTSQSGEPLGGVSIAVIGGKEATVTENNGNFQLNIPRNSTLRISYVGYIPKEI